MKNTRTLALVAISLALAAIGLALIGSSDAGAHAADQTPRTTECPAGTYGAPPGPLNDPTCWCDTDHAEWFDVVIVDGWGHDMGNLAGCQVAHDLVPYDVECHAAVTPPTLPSGDYEEAPGGECLVLPPSPVTPQGDGSPAPVPLGGDASGAASTDGAGHVAVEGEPAAWFDGAAFMAQLGGFMPA